MNQILFSYDDENEQQNKENSVHTHKNKFLKTISMFFIGLIVITIGSLGIFAIATDTKENKEEVSNIIGEYAIIENNINNNNIEQNQEIQQNELIEQDKIILQNQPIQVNNTNENQENAINEPNEQNEPKQVTTFKKDTSALSQINTKTRKTSSGTKYTSIGLIRIPSLNIKYQILSKTTDDLLKISLCKFWGPDPNEVGNLCILGHNYKTSKFFGKLPNIKKGAKIYITDTSGKTLTYKVYETDIIKETDVECTSQVTNGNTEITLITCYYLKGYTHATRRFIAKARAQ